MTTEHSSSRSDWLAWAALSFLIVACYDLAVSPFLLAHSDLGWHLAAGDLIRELHALPANDPWSFTAGGKPWHNLSWLWDVAASLAYQAGGFKLLLLSTVAVAGLLTVTLLSLCRILGAQPLPMLVSVTLAMVALPFYAAPDVFLPVAPQTMTLLFATVFCLICSSSVCAWTLVPLMLLWANLHGGFMAGFIIIGAFGLQYLWQRDLTKFYRFVFIGLTCLVVSFINPLGATLFAHVFHAVHDTPQIFISEWKPFFSRVSWPVSAPAFLYLLIFILSELATPVVFETLALRLISWFWLLLGLTELRYLSLFFVLSAPLGAANLSRFANLHAKQSKGFLIGALVFALIPFLLLSMHFYSTESSLPKELYPEQEIGYLQQHYPKTRLLNHWNYGGYLIFKARGNPKVFIDGRAETAYPYEVIDDYNTVNTDKNYAKLLNKYEIETVLWPKHLTELTHYLDSQQEWKRVYEGPIAVVYRKVK